LSEKWNCAAHQKTGTFGFDTRFIDSPDSGGEWRFGACRRSSQKMEGCMRVRRIEQTTLTTFVILACALFFVAAFAAVARAQNPSSSLTLPQQPEVPVSPSTPGTLPGTEAGPGTTVGSNPITGQPCIGGGSSALTGGLPTAPTTSDQPGELDNSTAGLPPNNSIYGLGAATSPGAC
jgi:hypothetical protein